MYFSRNHLDLVTWSKKITLKQNDLYCLKKWGKGGRKKKQLSLI